MVELENLDFKEILSVVKSRSLGSKALINQSTEIKQTKKKNVLLDIQKQHLNVHVGRVKTKLKQKDKRERVVLPKEEIKKE